MADKKYIQEQEGFSPSTYPDTQGNPTIGYGTNLNSPEVPGLLKQHGIDPEQVMSGERHLSSDEANKIMNAQMQDKERLFEHKIKTYAPNAQIAPHEKQALMDMMYNNPKLVGPDMLNWLNENNKIQAAKEMMLDSNKEKEPGLQTRRIENAEQYSGEDFHNIVDLLTTDERQEIKDIISQIKNPHERLRVFKQYPWLEQVASPRYGRILKD